MRSLGCIMRRRVLILLAVGTVFLGGHVHGATGEISPEDANAHTKQATEAKDSPTAEVPGAYSLNEPVVLEPGLPPIYGYNDEVANATADVSALGVDAEASFVSMAESEARKWMFISKEPKDENSVKRMHQICEELPAKGVECIHIYSQVLVGFSVDIDASTNVELLHTLVRDYKDDIEFVERSSLVQASAVQTRNLPWGLDRIDQEALPLNNQYHYSKDGTGTHVYIFDTGINIHHEEFRFADGRPGSRATADYDGCYAGSCGRNGWALDDQGHGTHCAGSAVGLKYGVAKNAFVHSIKVLNGFGRGGKEETMAAMDWAVSSHQANFSSAPAVFSMSLGWTVLSPAFDAAIQGAFDQSILTVVSAGNNNYEACRKSPARSPRAITVGATDSDDKKASYSNFGTCVDIFAPGSSILSAEYATNTGSVMKSGTSMATPQVAGVVALIMQANPTFTPAQAEALLKSSASSGVLVGSLGSGSPDLLLKSPYGFDGGSTFSPTNVPTNVPTASPTVPNPTASPSVSPYIWAGNQICYGTEAAMAAGTVDITVEGCLARCDNNTQCAGISWGKEAGAPTCSDSILAPTQIFGVISPIQPSSGPTGQLLQVETITSFNLDRSVMLFDPEVVAGTTVGYHVCNFSTGHASLPDPPSASAVSLTLSDDSYSTVSLPQSFRFYNTNYTTAYLGSNGYLTFRSPDTDYSETVGDHFDLPRISALFDDFDPSRGGAVYKEIVGVGTADLRMVFTFSAVPEFSRTNQNTFQMALFLNTGRIRLAWGDVAATDGLVGLSNGTQPADFVPYDFQSARLIAESGTCILMNATDDRLTASTAYEGACVMKNGWSPLTPLPEPWPHACGVPEPWEPQFAKEPPRPHQVTGAVHNAALEELAELERQLALQEEAWRSCRRTQRQLRYISD